MTAIPIVPRETEARLDAFMALLRQWNARQRLVSLRDIDVLRTRHLQDSLALTPLLRPVGTIADFGSGAGFPGLVIAIVSDRPVVLIEANLRKAAFLREAIRVTAAPATLVASRIEAVTTIFDTVMARALAPLERLLALASPRVGPHSNCLFPKGRGHDREVASAREKWHFRLVTHPSATDSGARILEINELRAR